MPLAYLTVWELTKSTGAALLSTAFIVFGKLSHAIVVYLLWTIINYSSLSILFTLIFFDCISCLFFVS